jgi:hypothetical protein
MMRRDVVGYGMIVLGGGVLCLWRPQPLLQSMARMGWTSGIAALAVVGVVCVVCFVCVAGIACIANAFPAWSERVLRDAMGQVLAAHGVASVLAPVVRFEKTTWDAHDAVRQVWRQAAPTEDSSVCADRCVLCLGRLGGGELLLGIRVTPAERVEATLRPRAVFRCRRCDAPMHADCACTMLCAAGNAPRLRACPACGLGI